MAVLGRATADGTHSIVADIGSFENAENPDNDLPDSNPYGVLALAGKTLVANAGANALFEIRANGDIRTLAVFEEQPFPGGPNVIDIGFAPDGSLFAADRGADSGLPGRVAYQSRARRHADNSQRRPVCPGGVAVAKDGTIHVTNFSILPGGGQVIAIRP